MKYLAYTKARMKSECFYKFNLYSMIFSSLVIFFVEYALWKAVYNNKQNLSGLTFINMFSYIIFGHILRKFLGEGVDEVIGQQYRDGSIVVDMVKPISIVFKSFYDDLGRGIFQMIALAIPLIPILLLSNKAYIISPTRIIVFLIMSFFAYVIYFIIGYILGIISFWTQSNIGIYMIKTACFGIFSGSFIPFDLYPQWLVKIANILPFKATYYFPVSTIMKDYEYKFLLGLFTIQLFWIGILIIILLFIKKQALKKLTVQGG